MTTLPTLRCTKCRDSFDTQKDLDDHLALHGLEALGKVFKCSDTFFCSECEAVKKANVEFSGHHSVMLYFYSSALTHLEMHEQMKKASKMLCATSNALYTPIFELRSTQIQCNCCYKLSLEMSLYGHPDGYNAQKYLFDSAPEFMQHFISEHLQTPPKDVEHAWMDSDDEEHVVHQCSFCGYISRSGVCRDSHNSECSPLCEIIHKNIVAKKEAQSLLVCHMLSGVLDSVNAQSCLQFADNKIIRKIVKRIML